MKRKVSAIFILSALLSLFLLQAIPAAAQTAGSVEIVTGAELVDPNKAGSDTSVFQALDTPAYFSDEIGTDAAAATRLRTDAFGVAFVVISDNDAEANVANIVNGDIT